MELDDKVCYCFHVSMRKLVNFTRQTKPVKASQLSECFGAGTGCGWCVPFLKRIHENVTEEKGDVESTFGMTAGEYAGMPLALFSLCASTSPISRARLQSGHNILMFAHCLASDRLRGSSLMPLHTAVATHKFTYACRLAMPEVLLPSLAATPSVWRAAEAPATVVHKNMQERC